MTIDKNSSTEVLLSRIEELELELIALQNKSEEEYERGAASGYSNGYLDGCRN